MANDQQTEGPRLVWTFPLVTRIQRGSRFLDLGSNIGSFTEGEVGSRLQERVRGGEQDSPDVSGDEDEDSVTEVEDEITDVRESGELTFGQDYEAIDGLEVEEVEIVDGVFVPTRLSIEERQTVRWINNDDSVHRVSSIEGEEFDSGQIEPGEEYEHTFGLEGTTIYVDTIQGGSQASGAIIVGDATPPERLPSESGSQPVLFSDSETDEEGSSFNETRSMSAAAEEKDDLDVGFSD